MRTLVIGVALALAMGFAVALTGAQDASARGLSESTLVRAGWGCGPAAGLPPGHCVPPGEDGPGSPTITVLVFEDGAFGGSEILWRADLYAGQPCPPDAILGPIVVGGTAYLACHHFGFGE